MGERQSGGPPFSASRGTRASALRVLGLGGGPCPHPVVGETVLERQSDHPWPHSLVQQSQDPTLAVDLLVTSWER